jgi:hypothetical protein
VLAAVQERIAFEIAGLRARIVASFTCLRNGPIAMSTATTRVAALAASAGLEHVRSTATGKQSVTISTHRRALFGFRAEVTGLVL